ncbi:MAG: PilZ domain-containing protein [Geobacter sp.]|uniref:PilZ domain-containing protein n=1 Tax=Trichlorobacter sp. TaxID=2911007 RepID=UPI002A36031C|nr:PilZ domain-containing protein [Trichlorobacter sp.]MDY0383731.1 PilZ domain-containing protein [Trichlorobacter sp.]
MSMRKFSRVAFHVVATVTAGSRSFQGAVSDLSMNGLFLETSERLPEGDAVEIMIALAGTEPELRVAFSGRVARLTETGIGFHFEKVDLDSYTHLKNIIAYNMADPDKVMEEIYSNIEENISSHH